MSIFSAIRDAIFGGSAVASSSSAESAQQTAAAPSTLASARGESSGVDVAAMLDGLRKVSREDLDWRRSIVDLMKLLKIDSSHKARKELAKELGYSGDMGDSAAMNIWLHKQVMTKLAEHGGVVPDELKH